MVCRRLYACTCVHAQWPWVYMCGRGLFQSQVPGMQIKRVAVADTKGLPMYQPISQVSYQQAIAAMQLQQPQFIPVSCEYPSRSRSQRSMWRPLVVIVGIRDGGWSQWPTWGLLGRCGSLGGPDCPGLTTSGQCGLGLSTLQPQALPYEGLN